MGFPVRFALCVFLILIVEATRGEFDIDLNGISINLLFIRS